MADNSQSAHLFNFVVGVFGFIATITSTALCCRAYLPGAQMKILDDLLKETRTIYEKADGDGLFPSDAFRRTSLTMLARAEDTGASLRESTYNATTVVQEYLALFRGLSRNIMQLSDRVKKLRACLISTSEKKRRRRQAGNAEQTAHMSDSVTTDTSMSWLTSIDPSVDPEERSLRSEQVNRGSDRRGRSISCPPALSESSISVDCLRVNVGGMRKHHSQDVDQDDTGINSSVTLSETVDNLSRTSTVIDTPVQAILHKTLGHFCDWTTSIHPSDYILDAPTHDHDIARLPV